MLSTKSAKPADLRLASVNSEEAHRGSPDDPRDWVVATQTVMRAGSQREISALLLCRQLDQSPKPLLSAVAEGGILEMWSSIKQCNRETETYTHMWPHTRHHLYTHMAMPKSLVWFYSFLVKRKNSMLLLIPSPDVQVMGRSVPLRSQGIKQAEATGSTQAILSLQTPANQHAVSAQR